MPAKQLRILFVLSLFGALGLIVLQLFWIRKNWDDTRSIILKQLNYHFRKTIDEDYKTRVDSFYQAIKQVIYDPQYHYYTYDNGTDGLSVKMHSVKDSTDYSSNHLLFFHQNLQADAQRMGGIDNLLRSVIWREIKANLMHDFHHLYTRQYEKLHWDHFHRLKFDTTEIRKKLQQKLQREGIYIQPAIKVLELKEIVADSSAFNIANAYRQTAYPGVPNSADFASSDSQQIYCAKQYDLLSDTIAVQFNAVLDLTKRYMAFAYLPSANALIARKNWISWASSVLLIGMILFCLYRMYQTIVKQKQLDEMKNDFISNMTHELKSPVATIRAAVDSLQYFEGLEDKEKTQRYLNASRKQLERLDRIITEVLNTARYERKAVPLHPEIIRLMQVLNEIVSQHKDRIQKDFRCNVQCDPSLEIWADRFHFSNMLSNIIDNAIKYNPEPVVLKIRVSQKEEQIVLVFSDNGRGIAAEQLRYIFDKFYRVPSGNIHDVKGFGIGLFYVRQLAENHGGTVSASSELGKGTTITLKMPLGNA